MEYYQKMSLKKWFYHHGTLGLGLFALNLMLFAPVTAQSFAELEATLKEHPILLELHYQETANQEQAHASLGLPDPVITLGVNNVPVQDPAFDRFLPTNKAIGVKQSLPNWQKRKALSMRSESQAYLAKLQGEWRFQLLRARLISLLATSESLNEQIQLLSAREHKYRELEEVIQSEIDAGRPVVFRMADIELERADLARERALLESDLAQVKASLIDLVGKPVTPPPLPMIELAQWQGAASDFYTVLLADQNIEISNADVTFAKAAFGPDWGVSLTYQQREAGNGQLGSIYDGDDWFSASVSFTVPLWASSNQKPKLRAAKASANASRQKSATMARNALTQWRTLSARIEASEEFQYILKEKITALDSRINALRSNYESGLGDYSSILDAQNVQLQLKAQLSAEHAIEIGLIAQANSLLVSS